MKKFILLALTMVSLNAMALEATSCDVKLETDAYSAVATNALEARGYSVTDNAAGTVKLTVSKSGTSVVVDSEVYGLENYRGETLYRRAGAIKVTLKRAIKAAASRLETCTVKTATNNEAGERVRNAMIKDHSDL